MASSLLPNLEVTVDLGSLPQILQSKSCNVELPAKHLVSREHVNEAVYAKRSIPTKQKMLDVNKEHSGMKVGGHSTLGIENFSQEDKVTIAQFVMEKRFKTEVYHDLEKWAENNSAKNRGKGVVFKGHSTMTKEKLLDLVVSEALQSRVKIVNLPSDWKMQGLCLHNLCAL